MRVCREGVDMTQPPLLLLVWRPEPGAPTALAEALGTIRVSPEGASLLALEPVRGADPHVQHGRANP